MKLPLRGLLPALLALLFALPAAAHPKREILEPVVSLPAGHTPAEVSETIRNAFDRNGWTVASDEGGHINMSYDGYRFKAKIDVEYSATKATVHYLSSEGLSYLEKNGRRYISDRYNIWVSSAMKDTVDFLDHGIPPPVARVRGSRDGDTQVALIRIDDDTFVVSEYVPDHPLRMPPGQRSIGLRYDEYNEYGRTAWFYEAGFSLDAAPGGHYTVRYKRVGNIVKFKIVDDATGASVGKANDPDELLD